MGEKVRILQLIASSRGGGASHVRDLSLGLDPAKFEVTVAMPEDGGQVTSAPFHKAGIPFASLSIGSGFAWREINTIRQLLKNGRFHLLHVHGARAALYGRLAVWGMTNRPRVLFSIHGFATPFYPLPKRLLYLGIEKLLQRATECTLCVAQAEADLFLQHKLAPANKVQVVHPGIDVARFAQGDTGGNGRLRRKLRLTPQNQVILTVCRLHIPRDFDLLLNAFARLIIQFPQLRLLIVGDGPQRDEITHKITRLGLADHAQLLGFRQDIPQLLSMADIYVLTSSGWEGYPLSTLEAQAAGVPVIVTDAGGSKEAVIHGQTGLVVPKHDVNEMANAFTTLLADESMRGKMGKAGRERAKQKFSREVMIRQLTAVYLSTLP